MIADAAAAILAGGAGTRLGGTSKAFVDVGGRTILERQLAVLRLLFAEILVVAPAPESFAAFPVRPVGDRFVGKGAPAGVQAALAAAGCGWVFCVACDMPFLRAEAVELLAENRVGAEAVVPVVGQFMEPLFAFYSTALLPTFTDALAAGNPSLARLLEASRLVRVPEDALRRVDPGLRSLENVNTPEDLVRVRGFAP